MCSFWLRASVQKGPPHSPGHCSMPRKYSYETQLLVGRVVPFVGNRNLGRHVRHALLGGSAANWDQIWSRPSCLLPQLHRPHGTWRKAASNPNANSVQTCGGNLATSETLALQDTGAGSGLAPQEVPGSAQPRKASVRSIQIHSPSFNQHTVYVKILPNQLCHAVSRRAAARFLSPPNVKATHSKQGAP